MCFLWSLVQVRSAAKRGKPFDEAQANMRTEMFKQMDEATASVYYTSARCIDDGVIDPRDTRRILAFCLQIVHQQPIEGANTFGISRI